MPHAGAHHGSVHAGSAATIEFLSENSSAYEPSDVGFLKGLVRDANASMRRAVGDMVRPSGVNTRPICTAAASCLLALA